MNQRLPNDRPPPSPRSVDDAYEERIAGLIGELADHERRPETQMGRKLVESLATSSWLGALTLPFKILGPILRWRQQLRPRTIEGSAEVPPFLPDFRQKPLAKLLAILDPTSHFVMQYAAELLPLTPTSPFPEPHMAIDGFLVESITEGPNSSWGLDLTRPGSPGFNRLTELVAVCRRRSIPTIFWNRDDPVRFDAYLAVARLFDWVFTSDSNSIPLYERALGHTRIEVLPFAAEPTLHHPVYGDSPLDGAPIVYAGPWFTDAYPHLHDHLRSLLEPAQKHGVDLFFRLGNRPMSQHDVFPEPWRQYFRGALGYEQLLTLYRRPAIHININRVRRSPTMFSRKVFEVLASCGSLISNPSIGMSALFGDVVHVASTAEEAAEHYESMLAHPEARQRQAHLGWRKVTRSHTMKHRLSHVLTCMNHPRSFARSSASCLIVGLPTSPCRDSQQAGMVDNQKPRVKESVLFAIEPDREHEQVDVDLVFHPGDLRSYLLRCQAEWVAFMNPHWHYGPNYIADLLLHAQAHRHPAMVKSGFMWWNPDQRKLESLKPAGQHLLGLLAVHRDAVQSLADTNVESFKKGLLALAKDAWRVDPYNVIGLPDGAQPPSEPSFESWWL